MSPQATSPRVVFVPREIKPGEARVALLPSGAHELTNDGSVVLVQTHAGGGVGASDDDYRRAGASIVSSAAEGFSRADLVLKVKEPQPEEYALLRQGAVLFTYLHLAAHEALTRALIASGAAALAYETLVDARGALPLLVPMSEVAGRLAALEGARLLLRPAGGPGILAPGVPGVLPAHVTVIGGGVVGTEAARMLGSLGARVHLLESSQARLRALADILPPNVVPIASSRAALEAELRAADLVIGAVLLRGARAPRLITRADLRSMKPGAVLVDVAVDQGGIAETTRPTTHAEPTYLEEGVLHYAVANMPSAACRTSTEALTAATLPYVKKLAAHALPDALVAEPQLGSAVNVLSGEVLEPGVAAAFGLPLGNLDRALAAFSG